MLQMCYITRIQLRLMSTFLCVCSLSVPGMMVKRVSIHPVYDPSLVVWIDRSPGLSIIPAVLGFKTVSGSVFVVVSSSACRSFEATICAFDCVGIWVGLGSNCGFLCTVSLPPYDLLW